MRITQTARTWLRQAGPGISFAVMLALTAKLTAGLLAGPVSDGQVTPLSPVLCAVLLGLLWRNCFGVPEQFDRGLHWVIDTLLKVGIALVGLRLTLVGAGEIAATALPIVAGCITTALIAGVLLTRACALSPRLAVLLSAGTAVCGCTAVVALSPVIRARAEDTGFAVLCVVVLGCVGMLLYPSIAHHFFTESPLHAGIFLGTSIHDTSQVVGAALMYSQLQATPDTLAAASITKLLRNLSMAALIPLAAWLTREPGAPSQAASWRRFALPGFVMCFVLLIMARTAGDTLFAADAHWTRVVLAGQLLSELLLICGMAAVGLSVNLTQLRAVGWRPLVAATAIAIAVCVVSLCLTLLALRSSL